MTEYVASPPTTDQVKLCREYEITIRHLKELLDAADAENERLQGTIQELTVDLFRAEEQSAQAIPPTHG